MGSSNEPKIYLAKNVDDCLNFIPEKRFFLKKYNKYLNPNSWIILEIDITLLGGDISIMKDPKMKNAFYTYEPIPFRCIKVFKEINLT